MAESSIILTEGLKIILAILCLVILIALGYKLYQAVTQNTELAQAREHLETLEEISTNLKNGESYNYLLTGPKNWYLVSYDINKIAENPKIYNLPSSCNGKSCICFCDGSDIDHLVGLLIQSNTGLDYFYSYFYYSTSSSVIYSTNGQVGYFANGFDFCQKKSACKIVDNVNIDYPQYFDFGESVSLLVISPNIKVDSQNVYVPWIRVNQTKSLVLRKDFYGKVTIG